MKHSYGLSDVTAPSATLREPVPSPDAVELPAQMADGRPAVINGSGSRHHTGRSAVDDALIAQAVLNGGASAGPSRQRPVSQSTTASVKGKAPQIISSLFSSNPHHKTSMSSNQSLPGAASNAPLPADLNTFAGLGLEPLLVHHLTQKMGLNAPTGIQKSSLPYMLSKPLDTASKVNSLEDEDDPTTGEQKVSTSPKGKERALPAPSPDGLRDILIQSQTGSGKTLSYLLPIIQTLLPLSNLSYIDRSIGTLGIILAPTRELAQQIEKVLETLLSMALSLPDADTEHHYTRWLVSGLFTGGATKTHEKARLRKGCSDRRSHSWPAIGSSAEYEYVSMREDHVSRVG